jgi:hypothetical protein
VLRRRQDRNCLDNLRHGARDPIPGQSIRLMTETTGAPQD